MRILVYDTETSGLPLWHEPSEDPRQPHIVQAAAALVDTETRKTIASLDLIAKPEGWNIPDEVTAVHGITTERAQEVGVSESLIVFLLLDLWRQADLRVAHNENFDARMMRIAIKRFLDESVADDWKAGKAECTARLAKPIMKMAPTAAMVATGRRYPKTPKLVEAYEHFIGQPLVDAHSALADAQACLAVYWKIKDDAQGNQPPATPKTGDITYL